MEQIKRKFNCILRPKNDAGNHINDRYTHIYIYGDNVCLSGSQVYLLRRDRLYLDSYPFHIM